MNNIKLRKLITILMSFTMIFTMTGCSSSKKENEKSNKKGRYVEENYNISKDISLQTMKVLEDGSISMIVKNKEENLYNYISKDKGKTWNEKKIELQDNEKKSISGYSILENGDMIISYDVGSGSSREVKYFVIDINGNKKDSNLETLKEVTSKNNEAKAPASGFKIANNKDLFFTVGIDVVQVEKETYNEKNRYSNGQLVNNFTLVDKYLIVNDGRETIQYNIENGEKEKTIEGLENIRLVGSNDKDTAYYYNEKGMHSYNLESKESKLLIDSSLSKFSDQSSVVGFNVDENNDFLVAFDVQGSYLVNYTYSEEASVSLDKELKIYSLLSNKGIEDAVTKYKNQHPDIQVTYESGLDGSGRVTEMDAIKKLNTEIMAGNGPDVIVLDNLPVESYIKEGLLEDMSDIISEYTSKDLIFKSIEKANTIDDKIYQFPTTITLPMAIGKKDVVQNINDLDSLLKTTKELSSKSDNRILQEGFKETELVAALYYLYGYDWLNEDNSINEDNLKKFLESSKEIYELNTEKYNNYLNKLNTGIERKDIDLDANIFDVENQLSPRAYPHDLGNDNPSNIVYGGLVDSNLYADLVSVLNKNSDLDYKILSRGNENIYIPRDIVGISSKAKNKETAKDFVKELLSQENQNNYRTGFPVNKDAFKDQFDIENMGIKGAQFDEASKHYVLDSDGGAVETNFKRLWPNEDDVKRLMDEVEKVDTTPSVNLMLIMEVANQFKDYVRDEINLDEAVKNVVDNLELYLAE